MPAFEHPQTWQRPLTERCQWEGGWRGGTQPREVGPGWAWGWVHPYSLPGVEDGGVPWHPDPFPLAHWGSGKGAPSTVLCPHSTAGSHPPSRFSTQIPAFPPRFPLSHCRGNLRHGNSAPSARACLTCALPIPGASPPEGWGGWCGWPGGRFRLQGASLGIAVCPEPPRRPQNQRLSVLQQLKRRAGRFALEAAGFILPTGAGLGIAGTWQLLLGLSGGSRGGRGGKRLGSECC